MWRFFAKLRVSRQLGKEIMAESSPIRSRSMLTRFADVIIRELDRPGVTLKSLAHRLGWPEETLRRYRDGEQSPNDDRISEAARLMSHEMKLDLVLCRAAQAGLRIVI